MTADACTRAVTDRFTSTGIRRLPDSRARRRNYAGGMGSSSGAATVGETDGCFTRTQHDDSIVVIPPWLGEEELLEPLVTLLRRRRTSHVRGRERVAEHQPAVVYVPGADPGEDRRSSSRYTLTDDLGEVIVEILIWPVAILIGGGILWAVLTEVVYRLARVARRGWGDEGLALRDRQSGELPKKTVL
jgi:hypothetical protein